MGLVRVWSASPGRRAGSRHGGRSRRRRAARRGGMRRGAHLDHRTKPKSRVLDQPSSRASGSGGTDRRLVRQPGGPGKEPDSFAQSAAFREV